MTVMTDPACLLVYTSVLSKNQWSPEERQLRYTDKLSSCLSDRYNTDSISPLTLATNADFFLVHVTSWISSWKICVNPQPKWGPESWKASAWLYCTYTALETVEEKERCWDSVTPGHSFSSLFQTSHLQILVFTQNEVHSEAKKKISRGSRNWFQCQSRSNLIMLNIQFRHNQFLQNSFRDQKTQKSFWRPFQM